MDFIFLFVVYIATPSSPIGISNRWEPVQPLPPQPSQSQQPQMSQQPHWNCRICTYANHPQMKCCEICEQQTNPNNEQPPGFGTRRKNAANTHNAPPQNINNNVSAPKQANKHLKGDYIKDSELLMMLEMGVFDEFETTQKQQQESEKQQQEIQKKDDELQKLRQKIVALEAAKEKAAKEKAEKQQTEPTFVPIGNDTNNTNMDLNILRPPSINKEQTANMSVRTAAIYDEELADCGRQIMPQNYFSQNMSQSAIRGTQYGASNVNRLQNYYRGPLLYNQSGQQNRSSNCMNGLGLNQIMDIFQNARNQGRFGGDFHFHF